MNPEGGTPSGRVTDSVAPQVSFTSELPVEQRSQLEDLLFFNENQPRYRHVIVESIERFGEPQIVDEGGRLRLHTRRLGEVQALFAVQPGSGPDAVTAVAIYARTADATVTLLHVVVHPQFAASGPAAGEMVTLRLVQEVVRAVSRIKAVQRVELLYGAADRAAIKVRRGPR